ncbi:MAG: hypothetical protein QOF84_2316 [Streptomyces sp.]|jgi:hypothetical protein|nr:hypothetical protein [Streptomyces sp.]
MADPQVPGRKVGARTEFCAIGDIIPGREGKLRQVLAKQMANARPIQEALEKVGLIHEARFVVLDGGKRLMFCSSFDGDFDPYIDDFAATVVGPNFDDIWNNVEGYPGVKSPGIKDWFKAHAIRADHYFVAYPKPTVKQIWQALAVQEAFEKVLDTPGASEALQAPALKPLVALAAN